MEPGGDPWPERPEHSDRAWSCSASRLVPLASEQSLLLSSLPWRAYPGDARPPKSDREELQPRSYASSIFFRHSLAGEVWLATLPGVWAGCGPRRPSPDGLLRQSPPAG